MLKLLIIAVLLAVGHSVKTKKSNQNTRIYDGNLATFGQFPWQVGVVIFDDDGSHFCGGTLWSSLHVLTAAECIKSGLKGITVYLGDTQLYKGQAITVDTICIHNKYDPEYGHYNAAVLLLTTKPELDYYIHPIGLASESDVLEENVEVVISGWGSTGLVTEPPISQDLTYANVTTISNEACASIYGDSYVDSSTLCTIGDNYQGSCNYDLGGPLIANGRFILHGVITAPPGGGCGDNRPSRNVRVPALIDWLFEVAGNNLTSPGCTKLKFDV